MSEQGGKRPARRRAYHEVDQDFRCECSVLQESGSRASFPITLVEGAVFYALEPSEAGEEVSGGLTNEFFALYEVAMPESLHATMKWSNRQNWEPRLRMKSAALQVHCTRVNHPALDYLGESLAE